MMTVRIKDIAAEAGVSPTTVSNVIHGNTKKVSPATIKKIEKILNERQYIPSMGAKMLAGNSSHLVGILIGRGRGNSRSLAEDPFTSVLLSTLEQNIFDHGYYTLFHMSDTPEDTWKLAAAWNVEGLITIGLSPSDNRRIQERCHVPLVTIDVYYNPDELPGAGNIGLQDYEGGNMMASWLISKGHRDFLFLSDNDTGVDHMRWLGIIHALGQKGLNTQKRHLILPKKRSQRFEFYQMNRNLFLKSKALFFASDFYACEAVNYFSSAGIDVPKDLSVAGFDDSVYSCLCYPNLTTIRQDVPAKGKAAVDKLFALIGGETGILMNERLPVELIVRDSVAHATVKGSSREIP